MVKMVLSSHLGRHLEYLIFPKSDEVAPDGFGFSTLKLSRISKKTLSVPKFKVFSFSTGLKYDVGTLNQTIFNKVSNTTYFTTNGNGSFHVKSTNGKKVDVSEFL